MGVYIKGLEMPKFCKNCRYCVNMNEYPFLACFITQKGIPFDTDKMENCPLVEIVTCGECKYYYPYKHYDGRILGWHCQAPNQQTDFLEPTHYCGFGERKK